MYLRTPLRYAPAFGRAEWTFLIRFPAFIPQRASAPWKHAGLLPTVPGGTGTF